MPKLQTYEEQLRSRKEQNCASTHRWSAHSDSAGLSGEQALADYFDYRHEMINKPGGDNGIDRQLLLRTPNGPEWINVDVKAAAKPRNLLVDVTKVRPHTIYILGHYHPETDTTDLLGWQWGARIMEAPTEDWCGNGTIVHYVPAAELRSMNELRERFTGESRDAVLQRIYIW